VGHLNNGIVGSKAALGMDVHPFSFLLKRDNSGLGMDLSLIYGVQTSTDTNNF
jgi:hypothetical protein